VASTDGRLSRARFAICSCVAQSNLTNAESPMRSEMRDLRQARHVLARVRERKNNSLVQPRRSIASSLVLYQDFKQEFGLRHFEGRGWREFQHHVSLPMGFLLHNASFKASRAKIEHVRTSPRS
jgi:SRSO17 transposase